MSGDPVAFNNTSAVDICSCVYLITYQALHSPTFRPHARMKLEFKNVTKQYGEVNAVNKVNCVMEKGIYGLLGVNGAGKARF